MEHRSRDLHEGQEQGDRIVAPTLRPDPLRANQLYPPYYGVQELQGITIDTAVSKEGRAALAAQARERERELRAVYTLLNAGAPINLLPAELLIDIFLHVRSADRLRIFDWLGIFTVCRHWFVVGSTAGKLWTELKVRDNTSLLRTGLARSRDAELDVEMASADYWHPLTFASKLVSPHIHRVRTLRLVGVPRHCAQALASFMQNPMPALRELTASAHPPEDPELVLDLPSERFPNLQTLDISHINVFHNLGIFQQLRKVNIAECFGLAPQLRSVALLEALRRMKNVQQFTMCNLFVCDLGIPLSFASMGTTLLSNLRTITIHTDGPLLKRILSVLTIPLEASAMSFRFPVVANGDSSMTRTFGEALPSDRRCLPALARVAQAYLTIYEDDDYTLECFAQVTATKCRSPWLTFSLEPPESDADFDDVLRGGLYDFVDVLRDAPLESVRIEVPSKTAAPFDWVVLFAAFPKLRRLTIVVPAYECLVAAEAVFLALDPGRSPTTLAAPRAATVDTVSPGLRMAEVHCPNLQSVYLDGLLTTPGTLHETVVTCLENRRQRLGRMNETALDELDLVLVGHSDEEGFGAARRAFQERVAPLVGALAYALTGVIY